MYGLETDDSWFDSMEEEEAVLYMKLAESVLRSAQPPSDWVQGILSLE
jgi:hypothetical protein